MVKIFANNLRSLVSNLLMAVGTDQSKADRVAHALVLSNLRGMDSHGVYHVGNYVRGVQDGIIVATASPEILKETPTSVLITGNWTFGHVAAKYGIDIAIEKAQNCGIAVVSLVQLGHIGRLGEYAEIASSQNMVGMVFASGFGVDLPQSVPYGGREKLLSTNPISMGFPSCREPAVVFDFATTVVAGAKVLRARDMGEKVQLGWLVDKEGRPTTNPSGYPEEGGLLPMGGHKGYSLMVADELLGRVFAGADSHVEPQKLGTGNSHQGVTMVVFKADLFQSIEKFKASADDLTHRLNLVPPAQGFDEVLTPGMLEERSQDLRTREGIPIPDDVWKSLSDIAASLNVTLPEHFED